MKVKISLRDSLKEKKNRIHRQEGINYPCIYNTHSCTLFFFFPLDINMCIYLKCAPTHHKHCYTPACCIYLLNNSWRVQIPCARKRKPHLGYLKALIFRRTLQMQVTRPLNTAFSSQTLMYNLHRGLHIYLYKNILCKIKGYYTLLPIYVTYIQAVLYFKKCLSAAERLLPDDDDGDRLYKKKLATFTLCLLFINYGFPVESKKKNDKL